MLHLYKRAAHTQDSQVHDVPFTPSLNGSVDQGGSVSRQLGPVATGVCGREPGK